jgi:hypothetical protein
MLQLLPLRAPSNVSRSRNVRRFPLNASNPQDHVKLLVWEYTSAQSTSFLMLWRPLSRVQRTYFVRSYGPTLTMVFATEYSIN